jgi:RiboL-PSP-HEPN
MPSEARKSLKKNLEDIDRLMELHEKIGGTVPGRRYDLEVLNKSAIVLTTACWEAYCEDIAAEALDHIVKHSKTSDKLPKELKKTIAKELKADGHDLTIWEIADGKWKEYLSKRLKDLQKKRNRKLNTPKTAQIDLLFLDAVGIAKMSSSWKWTGMSVASSAEKLNKFVELRGAIAHRGSSVESVTKAKVKSYRDFIERLASKTGGKVNSHVKQATGVPLWPVKRKKKTPK